MCSSELGLEMAEEGGINPIPPSSISEQNESLQVFPGVSSDKPLDVSSRQNIFHVLAGISTSPSTATMAGQQPLCNTSTGRSRYVVTTTSGLDGMYTGSVGSDYRFPNTSGSGSDATVTSALGNSFATTWGPGLSGDARFKMAAPSLMQQNNNMMMLLYEQCKETKDLYRQQQVALDKLTQAVTGIVNKGTPVNDLAASEDRSTDNESQSQYEDVSSEDDLSDAEPEAKRRRLQKYNSQAACESRLEKLKERESQFKKTEQCGPPLHPGVASIVNKGLSETVEHKSQTVKDLQDKYMQPENCEFLQVPKVNKILWKNKETKKGLKESDRGLQRTHGYLTKGMIPLIELLDKTTQSQTQESQELFHLALDSFSLLAYAHSDLSSHRRRLLKPAIATKYAELCDESQSFSSPMSLFGEYDELDKRMKEIDDSKKLGNSFTLSSSSGKKFKPGAKWAPKYPANKQFGDNTPSHAFLGKNFWSKEPANHKQRQQTGNRKGGQDHKKKQGSHRF